MATPDAGTGRTAAGTIERTLVRSLGVRTLAASILNVTVGGGIFLLPALVAGGLGRAAPIAYLVCAVAFGLIVLCFAEAGSRVSLTGGPYMYVGAVFGPFVGFVSNVLIFLLGVVAHAAIGSAFVQALNGLLPGYGLGAGLPRGLIIAGFFAFFAAVNMRGVSHGARMIEVATAAKLLPLVAFVVLGALAVRQENLAWQGIPSMAAVGRMSIVLVFAFAGVESALVPSGEVREPSRTVPRAIALAMVSVTILYVSVQVVAQGILGDSLASAKDAPLATAAGQAFGPAGALLLLAGAVISMFGYLSGMMLAMPRTLFAFARDGYLPSALAQVHPVTRVPARAIVTHAIVVTALAISGSFQQLAILSNISALLLYLLCSAAAFELRRRNVQGGGVPFRVPGGPLVPVLSILVILILLSNATGREMASIGIALAVSVAVFFFRRPPVAVGAEAA